MIFLIFDTSEFTTEAKRRFNELLEERKKGLSHLASQILSHRKKIEAEYDGNNKSAFSDITGELEQARIEDFRYGDGFDYDLLTTHYNINLEVSDIFAQEDEFENK